MHLYSLTATFKGYDMGTTDDAFTQVKSNGVRNDDDCFALFQRSGHPSFGARPQAYGDQLVNLLSQKTAHMRQGCPLLVQTLPQKITSHPPGTCTET